MAQRDYLRIGQLCRTKQNFWQQPAQVVRVAIRKSKSPWTRYFVTPLDGPAGYGVWVEAHDLVPLTPLELLAMEAHHAIY